MHGNFKHGHSGEFASSTYMVWKAMRQRCNNPAHKDYLHYGGRGIKVCVRWESFESFLADMGEKPEGLELERRNNDGNYEPSNCRWATRLEQITNSRVRHDNVSGLKGVTFKKGRRDWVWAYANRDGYQLILYRGVDFFAACCARKSWDARNA